MHRQSVRANKKGQRVFRWGRSDATAALTQQKKPIRYAPHPTRLMARSKLIGLAGGGGRSYDTCSTPFSSMVMVRCCQRNRSRSEVPTPRNIEDMIGGYGCERGTMTKTACTRSSRLSYMVLRSPRRVSRLNQEPKQCAAAQGRPQRRPLRPIASALVLITQGRLSGALLLPRKHREQQHHA